MSWFSGLVSAGYLLNRLATKARFSLGLPLTTSAGVTNCRQPSRSACCSMYSALFKSSFSCRDARDKSCHWAAKQMGSSWPLCGAMSQVHVWHQSLTEQRDEAHTPTPAAVPLSWLIWLYFLSPFQAHMLPSLNAFGTCWFKRSQCAPDWSKPTKDFSIISVNWRAVTRLAASTQLSTHLRWAHGH